MFSSRVRGHRAINRVAHAVAAHRRAGRTILDLTATNPTTVGIEYPPRILDSLADPAALLYRPDAFGADAAREAVAGDYQRRGIHADPARIVLTSSTSEAYSLLFKLLCEPAGDDVLVPVPSYPLFDHLSVLDGVRPVPYPLEFHGRWDVTRTSIEAAWTPSTRAVLAVSPNNPTGSVLSAAELALLERLCSARDAALVIDEVFADYPLAPVTGGEEWKPECLAFRLGGLSKSAALPQVKLGWILVDGPDVLVEEALARLELIADTYLSVSTPVQVAAPRLLEEGAVVRRRIAERVHLNLQVLQSEAGRLPSVDLLLPDAGWSAVLRVPRRDSEEEMVLALLDRHTTLVHPGFFFDFPHEAFMIVSLLPEPDVFARGTARVLEFLDD